LTAACPPRRMNKMNADYYIEKGQSHDFCEDFALAGKIGESAYAILSDGCSSSEHVDLGARLLVHAAKDGMAAAFCAPKVDWESFARKAINKAQRAARCFESLPNTVLDATLMLASVVPDGNGAFEATACAWGDGAILVKRGDAIAATLIRFSMNAPFYLSYHLDPQRSQAYLEKQGGVKDVLRSTLVPDSPSTIQTTRESVSQPLKPYVESITLQPGDSLVLVSDGIAQFFAGDNTPIPWESIAPEFINYKQMTGVFLRRRMNFFQRKNRADGVTHLDDVSGAAITV